MAAQIKKIAFLVPKPGMADEQFRRYWRDVHGPVVANSLGYGAWRRKYVQNHVQGQGPVGSAFRYAGIAQFWLPGDAPNEDEFAKTPIYRDRIRVDELNFIDMDATVSLSASEQVALGGVGPAKLVVLQRRSTGLEPARFREEVSGALVRMVLGQEAFASRIRGWVLNHTLEGSFRFPGGRPIDAVGIDCIHEFWFDGPDAVESAFGSPAYRRAIAPLLRRLTDDDGLSSFIAEELVFFDGEPTALAGARR